MSTGSLRHHFPTQQARFLTTVLGGLALKRALPAENAAANVESDVLHVAVDAVLGVGAR